METPKPMTGTWTLTAPDGRTWQADSPLRCAAAEQRERVSPEVALQRIYDAADEPFLDEARYRMLRELGCAPCDWPGLDKGHVLRFTNLDAHVDRVLLARGKYPGASICQRDEYGLCGVCGSASGEACKGPGAPASDGVPERVTAADPQRNEGGA